MRAIILISLLLIAGCATTRTSCDQAFAMRKKASRAIGQEKALLEAKAAGLEEACARDRQSLNETLENDARIRSEKSSL